MILRERGNGTKLECSNGDIEDALSTVRYTGKRAARLDHRSKTRKALQRRIYCHRRAISRQDKTVRDREYVPLRMASPRLNIDNLIRQRAPVNGEMQEQYELMLKVERGFTLRQCMQQKQAGLSSKDSSSSWMNPGQEVIYLLSFVKETPEPSSRDAVHSQPWRFLFTRQY